MTSKSKARATHTKPIANSAARKASKAQPAKTKLDAIAAALLGSKGATLAQLMSITGWQQHSVRGALAGALKKRGLAVTSSKTGADRVYRIEHSK